MGANYQLGVAEKLVMKESPHKALSLILIALNQLQVRGAAGEVAALPRGWRPEKLGNLAEISSFSARS